MHVALNRIQHVGIVVRDLRQALQFYKDIFGLEPIFVHDSSGPEIDRAELGRLVNVPNPDIVFAFMKAGDTDFELVQYRSPEGKKFDRSSNDVGVMHICFEVDDIHDARSKLRGKGIEFTTDPIYVDAGPFAGYSFAYFKGHDNLLFELFEVPHTQISS